jgi:hypothetical protein
MKKIPGDIKLHLEKYIKFTADKISEAVINKIRNPAEGAVFEAIDAYFKFEDYQYGISKINFVYAEEKNKCKIETYSFTKNNSSEENSSKKDEFDDGLDDDPEEEFDEFGDDNDDFGGDNFSNDDEDGFDDDDFFGSISFFENIKDWVAETFKLDIEDLQIFGGSETIGDKVFTFAQKSALTKAIQELEAKGLKFSKEPQLSLSTHDDTLVINKDDSIKWNYKPMEILKTEAAVKAFAEICFDTKELRDLIK